MKQVVGKSARVLLERLDLPLAAESAVVSCSSAPYPAILESSMATRPYERFSIFASDPVDVFEVRRLGGACPFAALHKHMSSYPRVDALECAELPFCGGWIGYIAYEAGLGLETVVCPTEEPAALPILRFCLYDTVAIFDVWYEQWTLAAIDWPAGSVEQPPASARIRVLRERLIAGQGTRIDLSPAPAARNHPVPGMPYGTYLDKVRRAKRYIEAGDIYQVNLTQRFETNTTASPLANYLRLRRASPSPRSAFLAWNDTAILSSSPELFLDLRGGHVVTRPIKGTRPRSDDPNTDTRNRHDLIDSEKDRAELNMIIDLLRNDLGRVCDYGSVRVVRASEIETHPTVFHRVATIQGDLRHQCDWIDLLRAAFPGGSITGAPKIRAMQIIGELEPTPRGVYCGAIGWIGLDGSMSLNIAIRTMMQLGRRVLLHAGGAIVADSDPEDEYEELLAKAKGMFQALGCEQPAREAEALEATAI